MYYLYPRSDSNIYYRRYPTLSEAISQIEENPKHDLDTYFIKDGAGNLILKIDKV